MNIRHAFAALWALRSKAAALKLLHPVQLRHASFHDLLMSLYQRFRAADVPTVPEWHQDLKPGDRIELTNKDATCWHDYRRTLVVTVPAYRNRWGEWIPPKLKDVTGMYEPGNNDSTSARAYRRMLFGKAADHE